MLSVEAKSLSAIARLESEDFPYAATLLVYVVLERCLKLYMLEKRRILTHRDIDTSIPVGTARLRFKDFKNHDDSRFIREFLLRCSLGKLELIYRVPHHRYSSYRNKVFHSNFYISDQLGKDDQVRNRANRQYLRTARAHLIEASERYFHRPIISSSNGLLRFQT